MKLSTLLVSLSVLIFWGCTTVSLVNTSNQQKFPNGKLKINLDKNIVHSTTDPIIVYDKLTFGSGFNSATHKEHFSVVDYNNVDSNTEIIANATGNTGRTTITTCESKEELRNSLDITKSVTAKFNYAGAKASYTNKEHLLNETAVTRYNKIAIVKAEYVNEPRVIINPSIDKQLLELAKKDPVQFMHTCGDMFVSKIYTGGALYGVFDLKARNSSEKESNQSFIEVTGEYLGNSVRASTDVTKVREKFNETKQNKTIIITEGGAMVTPSDGTLESFLKFTGNFKKEVSTKDGAPVVLYVQLEPYENIAGFPKIDFSPIRVHQRSFLEKAQKCEDALQTSIDNANYVLNNSFLFSKNDSIAADTVNTNYQILQTSLYEIVQKVKSNFELVEHFQDELAQLDSITLFNPKIKFDNSPSSITFDLTRSTEWYPLAPPLNKKGEIKIKGSLESQIISNQNLIHPVYPNWKYVYATTYMFGIKIYKRYSQPYYQIRQTDVDGVVIYNGPWNNKPIELKDNVRLDIKMVIPKTRYYFKDGSKYKEVSEKIRKKLRLSTDPIYKNTHIISKNPPVLTIDLKSSGEEKEINKPFEIDFNKKEYGTLNKPQFLQIH